MGCSVELGPSDQAMSVGCGVGRKKEVERRGICDRLDVLAGTVEALDNASFANQPKKTRLQCKYVVCFIRQRATKN